MAAIPIFVLSEGLRITGLPDQAGKELRDVSTFVFLIHMVFAGLAFLVFDVEKSWALFSMTAAASLILSFLVIHFGRSRRVVRLLLGRI